MKKLAIVISFDKVESIPGILSELSVGILREIKIQTRPGWDAMQYSCIGDLESGHGFDFQFYESDSFPRLGDVLDWGTV